ncbi:MAG: LemA family protein [Myxococcota bacterium]
MGWLMALALAIPLAAVVFGIVVYNRLVALRNRYRNGFSQIDVQLKRRHDLIPNLVETAKGYLDHERETLEAVIAARQQADAAVDRASERPGDPGAMRSLNQAEGALSGALGRLFALAEDYPDLKANQTMGQLMEELRTTENRVAFARQAYNDSVTRFNTEREKFPNVLVAEPFGFRSAELFEMERPEEREVPQVSFA